MATMPYLERFQTVELPPMARSPGRAYETMRRQFESQKITVLEWAAFLYALAHYTSSYDMVLMGLGKRLMDYTDVIIATGNSGDRVLVVAEAEAAANILLWLRQRNSACADLNHRFTAVALKVISYAMPQAVQPHQRLRLMLADAAHMSYYGQGWKGRGRKELNAMLDAVLADVMQVADPQERAFILRKSAFLLRREGRVRDACGCVLRASATPDIPWTERFGAFAAPFAMAF